MSTVTFKNVAHLYMGCPLDSGRDITLNARRLDGILNDERDSKPILRRLESMTEEEYDELFNLIGSSHSSNKVLQAQREADRTAWRLSKHFDLFGLIESNQAIDAATLPSFAQSK